MRLVRDARPLLDPLRWLRIVAGQVPETLGHLLQPRLELGGHELAGTDGPEQYRQDRLGTDYAHYFHAHHTRPRAACDLQEHDQHAEPALYSLFGSS